MSYGYDSGERFDRVQLQEDEFGGLIGNFIGGGKGGDLAGMAGHFLGGGGGKGGGGGTGDLIGGLAGKFLGGGGCGGGGHSGEGKKKKKGIAGFIGGLIGGKKKKNKDYDGGGGYNDGGYGGGGGGGGYNDGGYGGGGGGGGGSGGLPGGLDINSIMGGIGGLIGGGGNRGTHGGGGGANINSGGLKGGAIEMFSKLVGAGAHKYLGIDAATGKIIGAVAGNLIFGLGGKDNGLGNIGKAILDSIISGKFKRKVDPYVPPAPTPIPGEPRPMPGDGQDFYSLRDECLRNKMLFEDNSFPASDSSLFFSKRAPINIEWKRPGEICREPQLFVEGHSRFDVIQGELGDCWLLAAAANLTLRDELFYRVVPPDQSFTENYCGIFHFQFWQYGRWVDVVIDDRLPTSHGQLLYMHSRDNTEYWSALLEKAYAKLHGSYEALKGGTTSEALEDFTGGLTEFFDLKQAPKNMLQMIFRAFEMGSLMGCSIEADPNQWEAKLSNGLVRGHAYSITGMRKVNGPRGQEYLLRIRNPWGNEQEWNGRWSDRSSEWNSVPDHEKQAMGLEFAHDGEAWMCFEDFMRTFEKLEICNLGPDVMEEVYEMTGVQYTKIPWATNNHDGVWKARCSAGGCRNYINTFANNPQYRISLTDADPDDDDELCTCVLAVLQKYRRQLRSSGIDMLAIGFAVYKINNVRGKLGADFFSQAQSTARSPCFINLREVTGRFRLPPGDYVMVPSTFEPDEEGEFMVRIFTNAIVESEEL